jgi:hypothetical protein
MEKPSTPLDPPKPVYKTETTGTLSGDMKEAVKVSTRALIV